MSQQIVDQIVRTSDGDLVTALFDIVKSEHASQVSMIRVSLITGDNLEASCDNWEDNEELLLLKDKQCRVIRAASLLHKDQQRGELITITRNLTGNNPATQLFDTLTLYVDNFPGEATDFVNFVDVVQARLRTSSSVDLGSLLGPDVEKHFFAREEALNRLETMVIGQNNQLADQRKSLEQDYDTRLKELEDELENKRSELEKENELSQGKLNEQEEALAKRKQEIDDRTSTHARREDRKELLQAISSDKRLALSPETYIRRMVVHVSYAGLLAFFVVMIYRLYNLETTGTEVDYFLVGSRATMSLAFIVTAGFYIRWLNLFASRSAAEDFKLKQLELDVQRASWLVELHFESLAAGDENRFPVELMERLSKNLFSSEEYENESVTASDALASALIGSAGKLRLNIAGNELEFNKKGLSKLAKTKFAEEE